MWVDDLGAGVDDTVSNDAESSASLAALGGSVTARLCRPSVVTVERGPVGRFAGAIHDDNPIFQRRDAATAAGLDDIPVPPTFAFSALEYWGSFADDQPAGEADEPNPLLDAMTELMRRGGIALHAEQEFLYERPLLVGDVVTQSGRLVDRYEKRRNDVVLTFLVVEVEHHDLEGELVLTTKSTFVHRSM